MADEEKSTQPWSATFVRLRVETFFVSFLIFAVTLLDLNITRFPSVGLEFSHPASRGTIEILLYLMAIYLVVCWIIRYQVEISEHGFPRETYFENIQRIESALESVRRFEPLAFDFANWSNAFTTVMKKAGNDATQVIHGELVEISRSLKGIESVSKTNPAILGDISEKLKYFEEKISAVTISEADLLRKIADEKIEEARNGLTKTRDLYLNTIKQRGPDIAASMSDISVSFKTLSAKIGRFRTFLGWDKIIMGFWVPLIVCFALILTSTPQALRDIQPASSVLYHCFSDREKLMICLYRSSPAGHGAH